MENQSGLTPDELQHVQKLANEKHHPQSNADSALDPTQKARNELDLSNAKQDFDFKKKSFIGALWGAAMLAMAAWSFAVLALLLIFIHGPSVWFALLLPVTFLTPATIIFIAILRGIYKDTQDKEASPVQSGTFLKLVEEVKKAINTDQV